MAKTKKSYICQWKAVGLTSYLELKLIGIDRSRRELFVGIGIFEIGSVVVENEPPKVREISGKSSYEKKVDIP